MLRVLSRGAAGPSAALRYICRGRESRQDFLSAALAPELITNRAVWVYPFIVDENYLHNTAQRNLYLALFPRCNARPCGGAQKRGFGPKSPGR